MFWYQFKEFESLIKSVLRPFSMIDLYYNLLIFFIGRNIHGEGVFEETLVLLFSSTPPPGTHSKKKKRLKLI